MITAISIVFWIKRKMAFGVGAVVALFTHDVVCLSDSKLRTAERPPNLVFILADDLGWSDTTLYGTTSFYETPNIERLAKRGMLFTNAYSAHPLCSPTRSAS